jgi:DNA-binding NarL/FixJ family response regulator
MIRCLIVDDQDLIRHGLTGILDAQPDITVVAEARTGLEALQVAQSDPELDVVLMDIRMPGMDGLETTRRLVASGHRARILVLTTFDLDEYVYSALRAGASGFLLKRARGSELADAVRVAAAGDAIIDPAVTRRLLEHFCASQPAEQHASSRLAVLTDRETTVLSQVAQGLSNLEIARSLFITEHTVKTHVSRILSKTGTRDRAQAIVLAYDSGLVMPGQQRHQDRPA